MEYYLLFLVMSFLLFGAMFLYWGVVKKSRNFNAYELVGVAFASLVISSVVVTAGMFSETSDTEVWNGKVVDKKKERVSCSHSYDCNCKNVTSCSGSGKDKSCSTTRQCDTCYEHSNDYDWDVKSTVGNFTIDRIDRQGVQTPPRWTAVQIGEPASKTHTFVNYVKAAKNNVLNREGTKITYAMPGYPANVYDYWKIDRAVSPDNAMPNLAEWNQQISMALRDLGTARQVNLVLVFTKSPENYANQLNAAWVGGKKNDVIVVIGTTDNVKPDWVKVLSWSKREDFKINIRESLMEMPDLKAAPVVTVIANTLNKSFERRQMAEFEYLKYDIEPPFWAFIAALILFFVPLGVYIYSRFR